MLKNDSINFFQSKPGANPDFLKRGGKQGDPSPTSQFHRKYYFGQEEEEMKLTSDKLSDQNNERIYHVKQTVENRRPSKMGDVVTLLFVHFNFIIQLRNMFLFLKSIHIAY
jgi:hypothetical protein